MSNQALQKQNQQVQTAKPRALEVMAARLNIEPGKMMATLKGTVFPTCTDDELAMMIKGRDFVTGLPRSAEMKTNEIVKAIARAFRHTSRVNDARASQSA